MLRIAAISIALLAPIATVNAAEPPLARMEEVVQSYLASQSFMGAVLVEKDGKIVFDMASLAPRCRAMRAGNDS